MYFGAKVYRKLLSESTKNAYDVYIAKLHVMQVFWKLTPAQLFLKKSDHGFHWLLLWAPIVQNNLLFKIIVAVISQDSKIL